MTDKQYQSAKICVLCGAGFILCVLACIIFPITDGERGTEVPSSDDLLDAIEWVESRGDANAMGDWTLWMQVDYNTWYDKHLLPEFAFSSGHSKGYFIREAQAIGAYQIHKIYVRDVNRILGKGKYTYGDRWDRDKSREMTAIYLTHYWTKAMSEYYEDRYETLEIPARIHNGGPNGHKSPATEKYWQKIKAKLETK